MKRCLALVEGQTEETFIRDVLDPYLHSFGVTLSATLIVTKRVVGGPNYKGGIGNWDKVKPQLAILLRDSNVSMVTTMFDLYALHTSFPGVANTSSLPAPARALAIQNAMAAEFNDVRLKPFIMLHEFEALVFACLNQCSFLSQQALNSLTHQAAQYPSPEHINDKPATAPSARIRAAFPAYEKVVNGQQATKSAGVPHLKSKCPHFGAWVTRKLG
jgi:hypothetical protein